MADPELNVQDVIDDLDGLAAETHRRADVEASLAG